MEAKAVAKYVRCGPRKVRRYAELIRGRSVDEARKILSVQASPAAHALKKCMESAVANAENNYAMDAEELQVAVAAADDGLKMPRIRPRARGRADRYMKRTCHITVVVRDENE